MMSPKSSAERKSCFLVSKIKADLQTFDLISGQVGCLIDLVKVNVGVDVWLGHYSVFPSHPHKSNSPC